MKFKKNNKQIQSMLLLLVTIVGFAGTLLVGKFIYSEIDTAITTPDNSGNTLGTNTSIIAYQQFNSMWDIFDNAILFIIIGLTIGLVMTSFLIPAHPVFLVINIIGMIVLVFISAILGNVYSELIVTDGINDSLIKDDGTNYFEKTTFIMQVLPWICAVIVLLSTIVMFAKGKDIS